MSSSPARAVHHRAHHGWLRHLLLALSLVVMTLGVVGMHQLSIGHDVATGPSDVHTHLDTTANADVAVLTSSLVPNADMAGHPADGRPSTALTQDGARGGGNACPSCDDHQMAFGSCLLALTLLVISWMLIPPRLRHLPPFLLPRSALAAVGPTVARLVPALSLMELSLRRT